jgi:isoleucyl-tRNA synthetase
VAEDGELLVALDTDRTPDLLAEGLVREVAHRLQGLRKSAGFEISDRVRVAIDAEPATVAMLEPSRSWLAEELLADELRIAPGAALAAAAATEEVELDGASLRLTVQRSV